MAEFGEGWTHCAPVGRPRKVRAKLTRQVTKKNCWGSSDPCNQGEHGPEEVMPEIHGGATGIGGMFMEPNKSQSRAESKTKEKNKQGANKNQTRNMIREKRERLKIIFWNTAGIGNKDEEFWKYLREFNIINLTETWIELKNWKKAEKWLPKEFMWEIQGAYKDKKRAEVQEE